MTLRHGVPLLLLATACSTEDPGHTGEAELCPRTVSSVRPCPDEPNPCDIESGFSGDEYCMPPPPEGEGFQIHFGPKSYDDPAEVEQYALVPGREVSDFAIARLALPEERWYSHIKIQMRPGSHHLVNSLVETGQPEGFTQEPGCVADQVDGFPGTQNLVFDSPPGGVPAPENEGLGVRLAPDADVCLNHHGYNFSEVEQLREVWINVWYAEESEITQRAKGVFLSAGPYPPGIPPRTRKALRYSAPVEGEGRILTLLGHRHAWTERFAVWKNEELVYDSWHWDESVTFDYDSITTNPAPNPEGRTDGAVSGPLHVKQGDQLTIECDVNNTSDDTLTFKNQLYGGEMCLLFGSAVGVEIIAAF